ncbi:hypothetical protein V7x_06770 [Crateriforma conspicua]|uniref:Prenyltransferase n=1 Tax=Crateriforma conspicua TaxID=2527996 RepID=A0A5C6FS31_9PLAN|nr:hypothetical protein V7x_06770 [Crateriforma conspicua]
MAFLKSVWPSRARGLWRLILVLNVTSLDAPIVAVVWFVVLTCENDHSANIFSVANRKDIATGLVLAMTVWLIYCGDRLLDSFRSGAAVRTARHRFSRRNWRLLLLVWTTVFGIDAVVATIYLPSAVQLFGVVLALAVGLYLLWVHAFRRRSAMQWKEPIVGILFAAGVVGAYATNAGMMNGGRGVSVGVLLAGLFTLNCWIVSRSESVWLLRVGGESVSAGHIHDRFLYVWTIGLVALSVWGLATEWLAWTLGAAVVASCIALSGLVYRMQCVTSGKASRFALLADPALIVPPMLVVGTQLLYRSWMHVR